MKNIIIFSLILGLILCSFVGGAYYHEQSNQPTPVKIMVGKQCIEGTMSIQDWYFQQKLWVKLNMPEQLTQICN